MKIWIGRWIAGTAVIHTLFAVVVFFDIWIQILANGLLDTVGDNSEIRASVFFLLWGFLYFSFGLVVDAIEKERVIPLPKSLGWGLLLNGVVAVVLIPKSGFWLLFPPAISVIIAKEKGIENVD